MIGKRGATFKTRGSESYPPGLCMFFAECMLHAWLLRRHALVDGADGFMFLNFPFATADEGGSGHPHGGKEKIIEYFGGSPPTNVEAGLKVALGQHAIVILAVLRQIDWPQQRRPHVPGQGLCLGASKQPARSVCHYHEPYSSLVS